MDIKKLNTAVSYFEVIKTGLMVTGLGGDNLNEKVNKLVINETGIDLLSYFKGKIKHTKNVDSRDNSYDANIVPSPIKEKDIIENLRKEGFLIPKEFCNKYLNIKSHGFMAYLRANNYVAYESIKKPPYDHYIYTVPDVFKEYIKVVHKGKNLMIHNKLIKLLNDELKAKQEYMV